MDKTLKGKLKKKGWKCQDAAQELGVTVWHFSRVINGHLESRRIERAIAGLPLREKEGAK